MADTGVGGVARHRAADHIFGAIRGWIVSGELGKGARLPTERGLAERFGVSVLTVREAVRALTAVGLVDVRHGSGAYVTADSDRQLAPHLTAFLQLEDYPLADAIGLLRVLDHEADAVTSKDVLLTSFAATLRSLVDLVVRTELAGFRDVAPAGVGSSAGPMTRVKVADQILAVLRTDIVTGTLPTGARLPAERELATRFGVSGPTVREAIRGLSALGLIDVRHGSGGYVSPDADNMVAVAFDTLVRLEHIGVPDIIRLLRVLNSYAARLAVERASDEEIASVQSADAAIDSSTVDDKASLSLFAMSVAVASHDRLLLAVQRFLVRAVVESAESSDVRSVVRDLVQDERRLRRHDARERL